jgi:hypothetical protein
MASSRGGGALLSGLFLRTARQPKNRFNGNDKFSKNYQNKISAEAGEKRYQTEYQI